MDSAAAFMQISRALSTLQINLPYSNYTNSKQFSEPRSLPSILIVMKLWNIYYFRSTFQHSILVSTKRMQIANLYAEYLASMK